MARGWLAIIAWYALISAVTFAAFAVDKARSRRPGARRVRERTLHTLSALGGFPGALAAMRLIRHKNRKTGFVVVALLATGAHALLWTAIACLAGAR